jgi:ABC-type Fe3+-hydroxamate transport system substrate-binding protein
MDKKRRDLMVAVPSLALLGLSGCTDQDSNSVASGNASGRASAMASKKGVNNQGLAVSGVNIWTAPDAIFKSGTVLQYIVPAPTQVAAVINGSDLLITLTEQVVSTVSGAVGRHDRALTLKLPRSAVVGSSYNLSTTSPTEASLLVNMSTYNTTTGKGVNKHYDYRLSGGSIKVKALSATSITLTFASVTAKPDTLQKLNAASRGLTLNGDVTLALVTENVNWMVLV